MKKKPNTLSFKSARLLNSNEYQTYQSFWRDPILTYEKTLITDYSFNLLSDNNDEQKEVFEIQLSEDTVNALRETCKNNLIAIFTFVSGCVNLLTHRYTQEDLIQTGSSKLLAKDVILDSTTNILQSNYYPEIGFKEYLNLYIKEIEAVIANEKYPLEAFVERGEINQLSDHFEFYFNFEELQFKDGNAIPEDRVISFSLEKHKITFHSNMKESSRYLGDQILHDLKLLVETALDDGNVSLATLIAMPVDMQQKVLSINQEAEKDYPKDKSIIDLFLWIVQKNGDKTALIDKNLSLTYKEIDEKSNKLANFLVEHKEISEGARIAVELEKSVDFIVSILAILKTGGTYIPILPSYPESRKDLITNDATTSIIIDVALLHEFMQFSEIISEEFKSHSCTYDSMAYIMYTSGSTGVPKGVMISHQNVVRLVQSDNYVELKGTEVILSTGDITFDAITFEIWGAFLNGGTLVLCDNNVLLNPKELQREFDKHKVNTIFLTSGLFNNLVGNHPEVFSDINTVLTGGDMVSKKHMRILASTYPDLKIVHVYGPTENTTFSTAYTYSTSNEEIPIGKPISNSSVYILGTKEQLCPIGIIGEICLGGDGVALGYLNNPELTAEKFIKNNFTGVGQIYKSGDLGRLLPDGNIDIIGRKDQQVKIRGYRIEVEEIRLALLKHKNVENAIVLVKGSGSDQKELYAYITKKEMAVSIDYHAYLADTLPHFMIPGRFIEIEEMPLTQNKKIDFKALVEIEIDSPLETEDSQENLNVTESKLAAIWNDLLNRTGAIRLDHNFFELGGHSLKVTELVVAIEDIFDVEVSIGDIFEKATLSELSHLIEKMQSDTDSIDNHTLEKAPESEYYALSPQQRRLWLISQDDSGSRAYNMPSIFELEGEINTELFLKSFEKILQRHESFSMIFKQIDGAPKMKIAPFQDFGKCISLIDVSQMMDKESEILKFRNGHSNHLFDLENGPLVDIKLIKRDTNSYTLLLNVHHIIFDGVSFRNLFNEISILYMALQNNLSPQLPALDYQYKDYAHWLNQTKSETDRAFWEEQLTDLKTFELPFDKKKIPQKKYNGRVYSTVIQESTSKKLRELIHEEGATTYTSLLTAFNLLLFRFAQTDDFVLSTAVSERSKSAFKDQIGFFVNTVPVRCKKSLTATTFRSYLQEVNAHVRESLKHSNYPVDELISELDLAGMRSNQLFNIMFSVYMNDFPSIEFNDVKISAITPELTSSKFDLLIYFMDDTKNEIQLNVEYNSDLFEEATIKRLFESLNVILDSAISNPDGDLSEISYLSNQDKHRILFDFNNTTREFSESKTLVDLFEEQVAASPENTAIQFKGQTIDYARVNQSANRIAHLLQHQAKIEAGKVVAVYLNRSPEMIYAVMGTIKTGGAYVPLDLQWPAHRISVILESLKINTVITETAYLEVFEKHQWELKHLTHVICVDEHEAEQFYENETSTFWNQISIQATDRISAGGFINSFNGLPFSDVEVDQYINNVVSRALPYLSKDDEVLEIGCGSGEIMFNLADKVKRYTALDPSDLTQEANQRYIEKNGIDSIDLITGFAHEIDLLVTKKFNLIVIASTIQFFPDHNYLRQVLEKAAQLLAPNGVILIADVLDLKQQTVYDAEMEIRGTEEQKKVLHHKKMLYIDDRYFHGIVQSSSLLNSCSIKHRSLEEFNNELAYRYDVILENAANNSEEIQEDYTPLIIHYGRDLAKQSTENVTAAFLAEEPAYIIFTSGSTGVPNGVSVGHRAAVNLIEWVNTTFNVDSSDQLLFTTSLCFDLSVYDIFGMLASGGSIRIAVEEEIKNPEKLAQVLLDEPITFWDSSPSVLQQLTPYFGSQNGKHLRLVFLSGDWIPLTLPASIKKTFTNAEVISLGGATEATVWSNFYPVDSIDPNWNSIPYGNPIQNSRYYIFDENLDICPIGISGDLYIAGECLSFGYINNPELTAAKYVQNPHVPSETIYKTGDKARYFKDGNIEFLGRQDNQVKIRGYRIELGEIEQALLKHSSVQEAIVLAKTNANQQNDLSAYIIGNEVLNATTLRKFLKESLVDYMIPSEFHQLDRFPLTPNGKLDRKALLATEKAVLASGKSIVEPVSDTEKVLIEIWSEIFNQPSISSQDDFFDLGGHSLKIANLILKINERLGINVSIKKIINASVLADLALVLEKMGADSAVYPEIIPDSEKTYEPFPLTEVQLAYLWGREQSFEMGGGSAHGYAEVELFENVDPVLIEHAINKLIAKHPMLRTVFNFNGTQQILPEIPTYELEFIDLGSANNEEKNRKVETLRNQMSHHSFEVDQWPLFEIKLVKLGSDHFKFFYEIDPLISDMSSLLIIGDDFNRFMELPETEDEPSNINFRDYMLKLKELEQSDLYLRDKAFWLNKLETFPEAPNIKLKTPPASISKPTFSRKYQLIDTGSLALILQLCKSHKVTPTAFLSALYMEVLAKWSNQPEVAINLTVSNRLPLHPEINSIVGDFTSVMILDGNTGGDRSIFEKVKHVQNNLWNALEHRHYDGVSFIREFSKHHSLGKRVVFPYVFTSALNSNEISLNADKIELDESYENSITQTSQVFIDNKAIVLGNELLIEWDYVEQLFEADQIEAMFQDYVHLILSVCKNDAQNTLLSKKALQNEVHQYNSTKADIPETTLIDLVSKTIASYPENVAVKKGKEQFTYSELNRFANQTANYLTAEGVKPGDFIGVVGDRSITSIGCIIGVLKTGAAFVPIDISYPEERKNYILENSKAQLLLSAEDVGKIQSYSDEFETPCTETNSAAYAIYTSGSTGLPKGVLIKNNAVSNTILDVNARYKVTEQDRIIGLSSLSFDLSIYDIFGAFESGATLVLIEDQRDAQSVINCLKNEQITIWNSVPAIMKNTIERLHAIDIETLESLRLSILSGDWIPLDLPEKVKSSFPNIELVSMGGATEASIWSIYYPIEKVEPEWNSIPYGYPLANQTIYVLDYDLDLCPLNVKGDIYIGGVGLAAEYVNREDLTRNAFIETEDYGRLYKTGDKGAYSDRGYVVFLGREDGQVKINGYRIELGEIESTINRIENISMVKVLASNVNKFQRELVCFYQTEAAVSDETIRLALADGLPSYMIPNYFIKLDYFPTTSNGKIDIKGLLSEVELSNQTKKVMTPPETETEKVIAASLSVHLSVNEVDVESSFFILGANSITLTRLINEVEIAFDVQVSFAKILEHDTVRTLSGYVDNQKSINEIDNLLNELEGL